LESTPVLGGEADPLNAALRKLSPVAEPKRFAHCERTATNGIGIVGCIVRHIACRDGAPESRSTRTLSHTRKSGEEAEGAMICPFCSWREDPKQQALLSLGPVLFLQHQDATPKGTGIIIPVRHAETVFDLTAEESAATLALLRDVKAWMDDAYRPDGYTVGWNCGSVGGQDVMHAHLHVIPRFADEPYAGRGIRFLLKQAAR
jgi:histidine triad (HIT) family protein